MLFICEQSAILQKFVKLSDLVLFGRVNVNECSGNGNDVVFRYISASRSVRKGYS